MKGHIRMRGQNVWLLKYDAGPDPVNGMRRQRYATVHGSKRDAQSRLRELLTAVDKRTHVDPTRETVASYLERWFRDWANLNRGAKTNERDRELVDLHVKPHVGALPLQNLGKSQLAALYAILQKAKADGGAGLAPRTVGHVHRILHRALGHAVEWGLVSQNHAGNVSKPRVIRTQIEILSAEQVARMLAKLRGRAIFPLIAVALGTGLRRGELLALRWDDVDLDGAKLRVDEALEETRDRVTFKSPKTHTGRRTVPLPTSVVVELRRVREEQLRTWAGLRGVPADGSVTILERLPAETLVFGTFDPDAGTWAPRRPGNLTGSWRAAVAAHSLPKVSLHALRHTYASHLIAAGVDIVTVSRRLGHASPTITLGVYAHLVESDDAKTADAAERLFANASGTPKA